MKNLDIYKIADFGAYTTSIASALGISAYYGINSQSTYMLAGSTASSLICAYFHNCPPLQTVDSAIENVDLRLGFLQIGKATIGPAYLLINSATKSFLRFAFTTALASGFTTLVTHNIPNNLVYFAPTLGLAFASAAGTALSSLLDSIELVHFNIPHLTSNIGVAGLAQQAFLSRVIFNIVNENYSLGWGYIASACAGLSPLLLAKTYDFLGLQTNFDSSIFKNPILGITSNAASKIATMALENWYINR